MELFYAQRLYTFKILWILYIHATFLMDQSTPRSARRTTLATRHCRPFSIKTFRQSNFAITSLSQIFTFLHQISSGSFLRLQKENSFLLACNSCIVTSTRFITRQPRLQFLPSKQLQAPQKSIVLCSLMMRPHRGIDNEPVVADPRKRSISHQTRTEEVGASFVPGVIIAHVYQQWRRNKPQIYRRMFRRKDFS